MLEAGKFGDPEILKVHSLGLSISSELSSSL